ncbi:MAG: oxidoreductase [Porticoccus sp.]|jgi:uncharacterized protein (DUF934 family)|nr:oxidoreductase [Porticoccus sp.]|tara:strand:+ start:292 stop:792 length:501 start_codon:yes stop_codon:yes gene_type:complete
MPKIIKGTEIVDDPWIIIEKDFSGQLPVGKLPLLPMQYWLDNHEKLNLTVAGIWIDSDESVELVGHEANLFPLIAVNFPTFTDGRGFSIGRLLRERYEFNGQLRAIGNPIQDQLFYLMRCGFNSFDLKEGTNLEVAISSLNDFDSSYQAAIVPPEPLFVLNSLKKN